MNLKYYDGYELKYLESFEDIVHDMKIPLTIMYAQIQSLEEDTKQPSSSKTIKSIKRNWFRVMKLLNDLSDFEKIQKGEITFSPKNLDVVQIFEDLVSASSSLSMKKNIELIFNSNVKEKIMAIDKEILDRIILNILSNAIKYSETNSKIHVELIDNNDSVSIIVKNKIKNKNPISTKSLLERYVSITEHGSNISKTSKGIGLDIVKEFIVLLNGDINFEIDQEVSSITINLPASLIEKENESALIDNFYSYNMFDIELSDDYNIHF